VDDSQWTWRVAWLLCLVLLWLTWSGGMDAPFVYDDRVEVFPLQDRTFSQLHSWADYNPSRPLVVLSYLFDFHLADGALDVRTFHLSSWWMHVFAVGAGLFMAESLGRLSSRPAAGRLGAIAVLLWGVHPMVSETVLYISARSELLCGGFSFLALGAWATALRIEQDEVDGLERSWPWRTAAVLACVGAIASKETGMMVPVGLAAIELGLGGRTDRAWWRRIRWQYWAPLVALIMLGIGFRLGRILNMSPDEAPAGLWSQMGVWADLFPAEVERATGVQLTTSAEVWRRYIGLWLVPLGQTLHHGQADIAPGSAKGLFALCGWFGMLAGCGWLWRRNRVAALALILGGLSLIPSTSFVPLSEHMAEHRAYQLGLFLFLAIAWLLPPAWLRWTYWVGGALAAVYMGLSWSRVDVWSSEVGLWQESSLRMEEEGAERHELAERAFQTGTVLRLQGDLEGAEAELERAVELGDVSDKVWLADGEHGLHYASWNELGIVRAQMGDFSGAKDAFEEAIRIDPRECRAQNNLGGLMFNRRDTDFARRIYMDTLAYCQDDPVALFMLGLMHYESWKEAQRLGDSLERQDRLRDEAQYFFQTLVDYQEQLEGQPRFAELEKVKAWLLELTFLQ
jgi:tetratricopeptide (TPR) repeat protein